MIIEELEGSEVERGEEEKSSRVIVGHNCEDGFVSWDAKRVLIGAGARALFYPTLIYNVIRNKLQTEFRWWDRVHELILLGAVPFPSDVPRLKELGVRGVITLNEPYETLVSTSLYQNVLHGQSTYVHCKAGRGRSTTIVLCYLVHHNRMTPGAAFDYVRSIRPRVLLASAQWKAVQEYFQLKVKTGDICIKETDLVMRTLRPPPLQDLLAFDDGSVVVVTKADLDGYDTSIQSDSVRNEIWADFSVLYRVRVAGQAAMTRISCLWLRCQTHQKNCSKQLNRKSSCCVAADQLGGISVDIHVY
ncbi:hypothetical protein K2173_012475 [Erythroxylum novogranatense]|uniref:Tyrosine specific protein phosphatases domain-containing protein n=1 Tax=Erythroxylum novogranatense TaxID=1862640 RepID=A0AAV8U513_9ROSI|nr:hypothetical protein K2173_012475 [Erythroxylum novogranatense]